MKLNWSRGLLRAWIVGSALWIAGVAIISEQKLREAWHPTFAIIQPNGERSIVDGAPSAETIREAIEKGGIAIDKASRIEETDHAHINLWPETRMAILPPIALLFAYLTVRWIGRGFRPRPRT